MGKGRALPFFFVIYHPAEYPFVLKVLTAAKSVTLLTIELSVDGRVLHFRKNHVDQSLDKTK